MASSMTVVNSLGELRQVLNPSGNVSAAAIVTPLNGLWRAAGSQCVSVVILGDRRQSQGEVSKMDPLALGMRGQVFGHFVFNGHRIFFIILGLLLTLCISFNSVDLLS